MCIGLGVLFSCKNEVIRQDKQEERIAVFDTKETVDREQLVFLSLSDDYKLTEDEVYHDLASFLLAKDGNLSESESNTIASKSVDGRLKYSIDKSRFFSKPFSKKTFNSIVAKGSENSSDEVNFSVFNLTNKENGDSGFAIMSDDERIGSVLCVIEDCEYDEISDNPLFEIFMSCLNDYVEEVSNEWESITENDYELFKEKYGITDEEIQKAKEEYESGITQKKFWGYGSWSSWQVNDINLNNLISKTKWDQFSVYNDAIEAVYGINYPTGCGATVVAQIMAYHKWPEKYGRDLTYLKDKWSLAKNYNWNGVYDWDAMTSNPDAKNVSKIGKIGIGALMYEIAEDCKSKYSLEGTRTNMQDRINYLRSMGYYCDNAKSYSYNSISDSLHKNCPIMVRGSSEKDGHAWIIDGSIELKRSRDYYVFWIPFPDNEYQSYVHCNYGWSGNNNDDEKDYYYSGNGYYKSGVFNTSVGNYSNNIRIATNIRPK